MKLAMELHARMVIAGTLDRLHAGHYAMFHIAFARGRMVEIWVMDDKQSEAKARKVGQAIQPFKARCEAVSLWCDSQTPESIAAFIRDYALDVPPSLPSDVILDPAHPYQGRYSLHELTDHFGDSIRDPTYTGIVCSEETAPGCALINEKRAQLGMSPLQIYCAPLIRNNLGEKLSSTDIRAALAADKARGGGDATSSGEIR